jgi:hypothetical protein
MSCIRRMLNPFYLQTLQVNSPVIKICASTYLQSLSYRLRLRSSKGHLRPSIRQWDFHPRRPGLETLERAFAKTICSNTVPESRPLPRTCRQPHSTSTRRWVIDLQPLFFNLTLDTTTALLLGKSVYSLRENLDQDNENRLFAESFTIAQEGLAKRFRIAPWQFLYNPPKFRRACSNVHRFVERYIRERNLQDEKNAFESDSFIGQVAKESVSNEHLRDQLLNVLLAGRDTTACCLSWTLYVLT